MGKSHIRGGTYVKNLKDNILTVGWSVKLAFKIDAKVLLIWSSVSIALAILPAVVLHFNQQTISVLSAFLLTGQGSFSDVIPPVLALGIIMTAIGISQRINRDFLYFIMYDAYYFGMEEHLMDMVSRIELKTLMDKKYRDDHYAIMGYCGALAEFISSGCVFISKFVSAVSLLVVAANTSMVIFIISTFYIILILFLNSFSMNRRHWDQNKYSEASRLANYYHNCVMSPGVAKELRVYGLAEDTVKKWEEAYARIEAIDKKYSKINQITSLLGGSGFYIFILGIITYCIFRVADGAMTVDVFLMLYALGQSIDGVIRALSFSFQCTYDGLYYLNLQRKFVAAIPQTAKDGGEDFEPLDSKTVFKADNLCFSYDDETEVLHNLNFEIKKGETIALVGMNGSGKTTLVKLLISLFSPTKGKLYFYGKPYDKKSRGAVIHRIGMFFQDFYIFHATLRENIGFGDLKSLGNTERIKLALEKGGADKLPERYPNGLEQWLNRNVKKDGAILSGGEKQRLAVSRAHMSDKEILIFDEPAAALDPIAEMNQFHAIKQKITGRTAILISHRVGFARLADRILVLDKGRLVENGTHEELMSLDGIYAGFFKEQALWYTQKEGDE
jgi:ATP-binding cassette subfamily B protein